MSARLDREAMEILRFLLRRAVADMVRVLKNPRPKIVEFEACREALRALEATQAQLLALGDERRELSTELADVLDVACDVRDALAPLRAALGFNPMQLFALPDVEPMPSEWLKIDKSKALTVANELFEKWEGRRATLGNVSNWKALRYFCKAMIREAEELPQDSDARRWIVLICDGLPRWYVNLDTAWHELLDRLCVWPESVEVFERVAASVCNGDA